MRLASVLVSVCVLMAQVAMAAPETSLRPIARGTASDTAPVVSLSQVRPTARPAVHEATLTRQLTAEIASETSRSVQSFKFDTPPLMQRAFVAVSPQATGLSIRPLVRPDSMVRKVMAQRRERAKGAICGDPDIQGEVVGFVPGRLAACGIENGVRVRSVSGIALSQQAMIDCTTAKALKTWVEKGMKPAIGQIGGGVSQIQVAAHYACRTRNNQSGAKISEHGKGRAIDISGFRLRDGSEITLRQGWDRRDTGAILRKMHQQACGIFGTVLGPDSDRFHKDHFHFDTARYRSGSYCR